MSAPAVYSYGSLNFSELVPLIACFIGLGEVCFSELLESCTDVAIGFKLIIQVFAFPLSDQKFTLRCTIWRTFVQIMCPNSMPRQMQWVVPSISDFYEKFTKKYRIPIIHKDIGSRASLHWLGSPSARLVILYLHGRSFIEMFTE